MYLNVAECYGMYLNVAEVCSKRLIPYVRVAHRIVGRTRPPAASRMTGYDFSSRFNISAVALLLNRSEL